MAQVIPGTPPLVRAVNRRRILEAVRRAGSVSRAQLAKATSIRPPTVTAVIRELLAEGLVEEVGARAPKTGLGRPQRMVSLVRNRPRALGFEIAGSFLRAGLCDLTGALLRDAQRDYTPSTPEETLTQLHAMGAELLESFDANWDQLQGVGIALPGLVDTMAGVVQWSRPLGWSRSALRDLAAKYWSTDTDIVNNAGAGCMAEHYLGAVSNADNLIYLHLRFDVVEPGVADEVHSIVRIGSGIIIHGEPYHGSFGAAGELSQPVAHPLTYARDAQDQRYTSTETFAAAARAGEAAALEGLARLEGDIGAVIRVAAGFLDPAIIVLDSDTPALSDLLLPRLEHLLNDDYLRKEAGQPRLVASSMGKAGMMRGSIVPTLQRIFSMPRWRHELNVGEPSAGGGAPVEPAVPADGGTSRFDLDPSLVSQGQFEDSQLEAEERK